MRRILKFAPWILLLVGLLVLSVYLLMQSDMIVLNPKGMIAQKERDLFVLTSILMCIVVIPVFILGLFIAWKYRESNKKAKYSPNWDYNFWLEVLWWGVSTVVVFVIGIFTWIGCHELDPFVPLAHENKPVRIQVVALQWKWLFIYPEYDIATVNFIQFPEKTPINFEITSDAPMNSFWIPDLGSQIYAMPGMLTKVHLIADEQGSFKGLSANLSGTGFAGMIFTAKASTDAEFDQWIQTTRHSDQVLTREEYMQLLKPSSNDPEALYVLEDKGLFDWVVMKYKM
ncbi:MAG: ubiquinol oxidase subunit II [Verrucomicrobia bacterium]|nr:ubiquinol oxidase subunit II [Verrucomicrobiota bacterium]